MENSSPPRRRLVWLTLATLGTLLVLPTTRYLVRSQVQMEALAYSTEVDLTAERAAAARMPADYPVQLALAVDLPTTISGSGPGTRSMHTMSESVQCNRNILALARQFPKNPSVYANLLRYMTRGEMHLQRQEDGSRRPPGAYEPAEVSPETIEIFLATARKGAEIDPGNAYFPMMQTIGLLAAHRDGEALESFKEAGRCTRWREYFQDDVEGRNRLQVAAYGERGAMPRMTNAASLIFPQYAQLQTAARVAIRLTAQKEMDGDSTEMVAVRHAVMRCGGLMRSQGASYITTLVGIAITNIATSDPLDMPDSESRTSRQISAEETKQHLEARRYLYYGYMEGMGRADEAAWAKTELAAGDQVKALGTEALKASVFNGPFFLQLGLSWLVNTVLLSSVLVLVVLGIAAHLAGHLRPRKALLAWRCAYALLVVVGLGLWQWHAVEVSTSPFIEIQKMFSAMTESRSQGNASAVQDFAVILSLLVPALLVGLLTALARFQQVPLATGVGRGLRGAAIPIAACLFLLYGASLLPTAYAESVLNTQLARNLSNEPRFFSEYTHKVWPGDPQP